MIAALVNPHELLAGFLEQLVCDHAEPTQSKHHQAKTPQTFWQCRDIFERDARRDAHEIIVSLLSRLNDG